MTNPEGAPNKNIIAEWSGRVESVHKNTFWAILEPKEPGPTMEAEIYLRKLSEEDRKDIQPGSLVNWKMYLDPFRERKIPYSKIELVKLPAWTQEELDRAKAWADDISKIMEKTD